jgi:hypothetical protein
MSDNVPDDIVARHLDVARMGVQDAVRYYLMSGSKVKADDVITLMQHVVQLIRSVEDMTADERSELGRSLQTTAAAGNLFRAVMDMRSAIMKMAFPNGPPQPPALPPTAAPPVPSGNNVVPLPSRKPPRDD